MKKALILCFFTLFFVSAHAEKFEINAIYEASKMNVKEVVCGWEPDLSRGYLMGENDCYVMRYSLNIPMYGFEFIPKTINIPEGTKLAYYFSFFDSATPNSDMFHTYITKSGAEDKAVEALFHDRTLQGLLVLKDGETLKVTSDKEESYVVLYAIAVVFTLLGVFFIARRKK